MTRIVCDVLDMMMANLLLLTWYLSLGWATPGIGYNQEYLIRLSPCKPADCIMNLVLKKYALHVQCKSTTSLHKCFCCKSWEKYEEDSNWDFPHGFTISYAWWFLFQKASNPQDFPTSWFANWISLFMQLNPFAPGDFAEKRVLKLVEWFSGHCRAIKS